MVFLHLFNIWLGRVSIQQITESLMLLDAFLLFFLQIRLVHGVFSKQEMMGDMNSNVQSFCRVSKRANEPLANQLAQRAFLFFTERISQGERARLASTLAASLPESFTAFLVCLWTLFRKYFSDEQI